MGKEEDEERGRGIDKFTKESHRFQFGKSCAGLRPLIHKLARLP